MKIVFLCIVDVGGICTGSNVGCRRWAEEHGTGSFDGFVLRVLLPSSWDFPTLGHCSLFPKLERWSTYTCVQMPPGASAELAVDGLKGRWVGIRERKRHQRMRADACPACIPSSSPGRMQ